MRESSNTGRKVRSTFNWAKHRWAGILAATISTAAATVIIFVCIRPGWFSDHGSAVQAALVAALVAITGVYAWQAKKQADASVRMAEEASQPMIDVILLEPQEAIEMISIGLHGKYGTFPASIRSQLSNLGTGPALDLEGRVEHRELHFNSGRVPHLTVGKEEQLYLFVPEDYHETTNNEGAAIVVKYRDAFRRTWFESRRELFPAGERGWITGPLKVRRIKEEES